MKRSFSYRLVIAALVLGCAVGVVKFRRQHLQDEETPSPFLLAPESAPVASLIIEKGDLHIACYRRDAQWSIETPLRTPASVEQLEKLLATLEGARIEESISERERRDRGLELADYGLEPPRVRLTVASPFKKREILIGDDAPLSELVYARRAESDEVLAVSRDVLTAIPQTVEDIRDRVLVSGNPARVHRIELHPRGTGFVQLSKNGSRWVIQQPLGVRADDTAVSTLLSRLFAARVQSFVWDPESTTAPAQDAPLPADLAAPTSAMPFGLAPDEATVRVTVWVTGDEMGRELVLGKTIGADGDAVYARTGDSKSVYAVEASLAHDLSLSVADLRDRDVFPVSPSSVCHVSVERGETKLVLSRPRAGAAWMVTQPVRWNADQQVVDGVVASLTRLRIADFGDGSRTNMAALGLAPPEYTISVSGTPPDSTAVDSTGTGDAKPMPQVTIGSPTPNGEVYCRLGDENAVHRLDSQTLKVLSSQLAAPLHYFDRSVLALPRDSITSISIKRDATEQTIALTEDESWSPVEGGDATVLTDVVERILLLMANLRAARIHSHTTEDLAACGLDQPTRSITCGLRGDEGIQKTVLLGKKPQFGGVYAMVKGQDVVFVLSEATADQITANILKAPAPAPTP